MAKADQDASVQAVENVIEVADQPHRDRLVRAIDHYYRHFSRKEPKHKARLMDTLFIAIEIAARSVANWKQISAAPPTSTKKTN
jgi:hypothetical protein